MPIDHDDDVDITLVKPTGRLSIMTSERPLGYVEGLNDVMGVKKINKNKKQALTEGVFCWV